MEKDLKSLTLTKLERLVVGLGQPKYQAGYIFSAIQAHGVTDVSAITTLSKPLRAKLAEEGYCISKLEVVDKLIEEFGWHDKPVIHVFNKVDVAPMEAQFRVNKFPRSLKTLVLIGLICMIIFTS